MANPRQNTTGIHHTTPKANTRLSPFDPKISIAGAMNTMNAMNTHMTSANAKRLGQRMRWGASLTCALQASASVAAASRARAMRMGASGEAGSMGETALSEILCAFSSMLNSW